MTLTHARYEFMIRFLPQQIIYLYTKYTNLYMTCHQRTECDLEDIDRCNYQLYSHKSLQYTMQVAAGIHQCLNHIIGYSGVQCELRNFMQYFRFHCSVFIYMYLNKIINLMHLRLQTLVCLCQQTAKENMSYVPYNTQNMTFGCTINQIIQLLLV